MSIGKISRQNFKRRNRGYGSREGFRVPFERQRIGRINPFRKPNKRLTGRDRRPSYGGEFVGPRVGRIAGAGNAHNSKYGGPGVSENADRKRLITGEIGKGGVDYTRERRRKGGSINKYPGKFGNRYGGRLGIGHNGGSGMDKTISGTNAFQCPPAETYSDCGNRCLESMDTIEDNSVCDHKRCDIGCFCLPHFHRDEAGQCNPPSLLSLSLDDDDPGQPEQSQKLRLPSRSDSPEQSHNSQRPPDPLMSQNTDHAGHSFDLKNELPQIKMDIAKKFEQENIGVSRRKGFGVTVRRWRKRNGESMNKFPDKFGRRHGNRLSHGPDDGSEMDQTISGKRPFECPSGETYSDCGNRCLESMDTIEDNSVCDHKRCDIGCFCLPHLHRDEAGQCKPPSLLSLNEDDQGLDIKQDEPSSELEQPYRPAPIGQKYKSRRPSYPLVPQYDDHPGLPYYLKNKLQQVKMAIGNTFGQKFKRRNRGNERSEGFGGPLERQRIGRMKPIREAIKRWTRRGSDRRRSNGGELGERRVAWIPGAENAHNVKNGGHDGSESAYKKSWIADEIDNGGVYYRRQRRRKGESKDKIQNKFGNRYGDTPGIGHKSGFEIDRRNPRTYAVKCPPGETYSDCGNRCLESMQSIEDNSVCDHKRCDIGCFCLPQLYRDDAGQCSSPSLLSLSLDDDDPGLDIKQPEQSPKLGLPSRSDTPEQPHNSRRPPNPLMPQYTNNSRLLYRLKNMLPQIKMAIAKKFKRGNMGLDKRKGFGVHLKKRWRQRIGGINTMREAIKRWTGRGSDARTNNGGELGERRVGWITGAGNGNNGKYDGRDGSGSADRKITDKDDFQCPSAETYSDCGNRCLESMDTYLNPRDCDHFRCDSGCFCKPGLYRSRNRKCSEPKCDLNSKTTPKCPQNEQYVKCGNRCLENIANMDNPTVCSPNKCDLGCFCINGYYRNQLGLCVPGFEAGEPPNTRPACPLNEAYSECGNRCMESSTTVMSGSSVCDPNICNKGCFCLPGLNRDENGQCRPVPPPVEPDSNPDQSCMIDEQFLPCGSDCGRTCNEYLGKIPPICTRICWPGCFCKKGFFKNEDQVCVLPIRCSGEDPESEQVAEPLTELKHVYDPEPIGVNQIIPKAKPKCKLNEHYSECGSVCGQSCLMATSDNDVGSCPSVCEPGCFCDEGLLRHEHGMCVPEEQCICPLPGQICDNPNEDYFYCYNECGRTCFDYKQGPDAQCSSRCSRGCFCKYGFVRNENGQCVNEVECLFTRSKIQCMKNEVFSECGTDCDNKCKDLNGDRDQIKCFSCASGCFCGEGFYRSEEGSCVDKSECSRLTPVCGQNEEYSECGTNCGQQCYELIQANLQCPLICESGCFCKPGHFRDYTDVCILRNECYVPPIECSDNEFYRKCSTYCGESCEDLKNPVECQEECVDGCFCQKGLFRNIEGFCVDKTECDLEPTEVAEPECQQNEVYIECGNYCDESCEDRLDCKSECQKGCFCAIGYLRHESGICVEEDQCTALPQCVECQQNEYYTDCGSDCGNFCSDLGTDIKCVKSCRKGCFCKYGYHRNDIGQCVNLEQCN